MPETPQNREPTPLKVDALKDLQREVEQKAPKKEQEQQTTVEHLLSSSPDGNRLLDAIADFALMNQEKLTQERRDALNDFHKKAPGLLPFDALAGFADFIKEMYPGMDPYEAFFQEVQLLLNKEEEDAAKLMISESEAERRDGTHRVASVQNHKEELFRVQRDYQRFKRTVDAKKIQYL